MDHPPIQSGPSRIKRQRRWIALSVMVFVAMWFSAAVLVRAKPIGVAQGILIAAAFLFVVGIIAWPLLLTVFQKPHQRRSAGGTR
jgi:hypothetical protein